MTEIEIKGLVKELDGIRVLDDINLSFTAGRIYGLRGKNGCGKTMLLRALCGLIKPTKGKILIHDKILHKDMGVPESIGALIENPSFLGEYSGRQNLRLLAQMAGNDDETQITNALKRVGLEEESDKKYRHYSLGMKQKLGIANAIMNEPDIILLDEPINALDEESVVMIRDTLFELRDSGRLIIIACHDREELDFLSDEIYVMSHGKIMGKEVSLHVETVKA